MQGGQAGQGASLPSALWEHTALGPHSFLFLFSVMYSYSFGEALKLNVKGESCHICIMDFREGFDPLEVLR